MRDRVRDYALLLAATAVLTLPNLGTPSLWDVDEGVNAQTAREMQDARTWVIPTFNYHLRTAKPVMLYWLQRVSYAAFGVSEWSARFPSVLAGLLSILLTYELARRMFGRASGLLAGLVLASVVQFAILSHAATPDATLLAFSTLTYLAFWVGHSDDGRRWWVPVAAASGLAVLTKGPVGLALPGLVIVLYFAWNRELGRLFDHRLVWAALTFILVAGPWYALVASETRGEWVKAFLANENLGRFLAPMDRHGGPLAYYLLTLPIMFAPWSIFLIPVVWSAFKGKRQTPSQSALTAQPKAALTPQPPLPGGEGELDLPPLSHSGARPAVAEPVRRLDRAPAGQEERGLRGEGKSLEKELRARRFLICWTLSHLVFFSIAATKLPNYLFPVYPALAIFTARFLVGWREGWLVVPRWVMIGAVAGMFFVGVAYVGGMLIASRLFPAVDVWAIIGVVPLGGAAWMGWCLRRTDRSGFVTATTATSIGFLGLLVALPTSAMEAQKSSKELVRISGVGNPERDLRVAAFESYLPGVVYYSGREVKRMESAENAAAFLTVPTPGYLFITEPTWNQAVAARVTVPHRIAARRYDYLEKCDVLVVTNDMTGEVAAKGPGQ